MIKTLKTISMVSITIAPLATVVACSNNETPAPVAPEPTPPVISDGDIKIDGDALFSNFGIAFAGTDSQGMISSYPPITEGVTWIYSVNGQIVVGLPSNLSNGDEVVVKATATTGYKIDGKAESDPFIVSGLTAVINDIKIDGDALFSNLNITFAGANNQGTLVSTPPATNGVVWSYSLNGKDIVGLPNFLVNGDEVVVKVTALSGYAIEGQSESNPFVVSGLTTAVKTTYDAQVLLNSAAVQFSGDNATGTMSVSSLPNGLDYKYSLNGLTATETIPTGLENGDTVELSIFDNGLPTDDILINESSSKSWTVSGLTIPGQVFDSDSIMSGLTFSYSGLDGSGVMSHSDLPSNVRLNYKVNSGSYTTTKPTGLTNGDKIYLQPAIIDSSNGDSLDYIPTKLVYVSGLTVAPPTASLAPIDRNSTIVNNGASSYTVKLSSAATYGRVVPTIQYETDMFIYEIDNDLVLNNVAVPYSDVVDYIRAVEQNTQFGPGMYVNHENHYFNEIGKTTIPVISLQNGLAASTSVANSSGIEMVIGTGFQRNLDFFAATTIHELAHKDGQVVTGAMIENITSSFVPNALHSKYRDTMKNHPDFAKYTTYFDTGGSGLTDRVDTTAPIDTPWGEMPTGTSIWAPNVSPYIFSGNEMIARTVEIMGTNFDKSDYTTDVSQLYRTIGAMDAEFGDAMYNTQAQASDYADILLNDIYAYDHYGGHTKLLAHTPNTVDIEYVYLSMQFSTNYYPADQQLQDYLTAAQPNGNPWTPMGSPFGVYLEDLVARPTSMRFNTDFSNTTFEKDLDGIVWSVDEANQDARRQGMVDFFEWAVMANPYQMEWYKMDFYDSNHNLIKEWSSNELF